MSHRKKAGAQVLLLLAGAELLFLPGGLRGLPHWGVSGGGGVFQVPLFLTECIRCGMCVQACPTNAVRFRYGFGEGKDRRKAADWPPRNDNTHKEKQNHE